MQLVSVAVEGFRSLAEVPSPKVASPTLLSGHNDAGKSALLDAIRFLLNDLPLQERDRTYCSAEDGGEQPLVDDVGTIRRVEKTSVTGTFELSREEMTELGAASPVIVRRISRDGEAAVFEIEADVPVDERLCGYASDKVVDLAGAGGEVTYTLRWLSDSDPSAAPGLDSTRQWLTRP